VINVWFWGEHIQWWMCSCFHLRFSAVAVPNGPNVGIHLRQRRFTIYNIFQTVQHFRHDFHYLILQLSSRQLVTNHINNEYESFTTTINHSIARKIIVWPGSVHCLLIHLISPLIFSIVLTRYWLLSGNFHREINDFLSLLETDLVRK
jgi:hypothetical protein